MARFVCLNFFFQLLLIICSSHSQGKVRVLLGYFMHLLSEPEGREKNLASLFHTLSFSVLVSWNRNISLSHAKQPERPKAIGTIWHFTI